MADFTSLKTAIQNAIKQNGNEEITGNLLQEILLAIVTTLGDGSINELITALDTEATTRGNADTALQQNINAEALARQLADSTLQGGINTAMQAINAINNAITNGCVYAGIATPSTTPAAGKVFYLALTAGTYTNFNGLEVSQGINILKNNGSTWSLESFVGIDDAPTPSSQKLVKSGGILDSIIKDGSAFDLSAYNGGATYADLNAALTALNILPAAYKKGGMSMKYVQTSDNKYKHFKLISDSFTTDINKWETDDIDEAIFPLSEIAEDNSDADLNVSDIGGEVLVEMKGGHIKTKNFDSRKSFNTDNIVEETGDNEDKIISQKGVSRITRHIDFNSAQIMSDDSEAELNVADEVGNVVMNVKKGELSTQKFQSRCTPNIMQDDSDAALNLSDEQGEVIMQLKNGHVKTQNFDSSLTSHYDKIRFASWNIAHFNLGFDIVNRIDTEAKYEQYLPIYRKIFNKVNADIINICEFESPFYKDHAAYTTKRELFPNYKYYKDNATATSNGMWVAYFSHLPISNVQEIAFNAYPEGKYRYYLVGDVLINGKMVKVVFTHLTHDQGTSYNVVQVQQLIDDFANIDNVVIMADFNTDDFLPFENAGYTMLNHDYMGAMITTDNNLSVDNILVKGGSINNINVLNTNEEGGGTLSDHYLIYCDIIF